VVMSLNARDRCGGRRAWDFGNLDRGKSHVSLVPGEMHR
jgi:hypothetical protein